jgi:alkaline phosphatase
MTPTRLSTYLLCALCGFAAGTGSAAASATGATAPARNIIFFLGDGMGATTITAARIHQYQEQGTLHFETFERSARIKTYSNDAQTTDSAPSMGSYMTGIKINNEVISMADAQPSWPAKDRNGNRSINTCETGNGRAVPTILELAKARGKAVGAVTTTEMTHATPASTFAHVCNRNASYAIATQIVPGGAGYNVALGDGVDVLMGGGRNLFTPYHAEHNPKGRSDGRDLLAEFAARGYTVAHNASQMQAAPSARKLVGIYSKQDHLEYEHDRSPEQPSLAAMTAKAIDLLAPNPNGFFLMVEGGKIDHALHGSNAKSALLETIAFDDAVKAALDKMRVLDPGLRNTLIVVTADHDHTMVMNGYPKRGNPVLDIVRNYSDGQPARDADGHTYTTLVFGNGPNRPERRADVDSASALHDDYQQQTGVRRTKESHGGGDVKLLATGAGSEGFRGTMENTRVFDLMKAAFGM